MTLKLVFLFFFFFFNTNFLISQELDSEDLLDRLDRLESNIVDLQKGSIKSKDESVSSSYISRNENRLDMIETSVQENFGSFEVLQKKISDLETKLDLINNDIIIRLSDLEEKLNNLKNESENFNNTPNFPNESLVKNEKEVLQENILDPVVISEDESKKKYENAIQLLWADQLDEALKELKELQLLKPKDLMPNIQYWLGEVYYEKKNFNQAILEFGEGLKQYPNSIKGPDNMLKLGLSFSNLQKKIEACNVMYELENKYPNASKDVLQRAISEREKLKCQLE